MDLTKLRNFAELAQLTEKRPNSQKSLNSWKRSNSWKKGSCLLANLIHELRITSMVWNISTGQLGYLSGHAPSQLLHTRLLVEYGRLEKVLDILATTKNVSGLSTFFSC